MRICGVIIDGVFSGVLGKGIFGAEMPGCSGKNGVSYAFFDL